IDAAILNGAREIGEHIYQNCERWKKEAGHFTVTQLIAAKTPQFPHNLRELRLRSTTTKDLATLLTRYLQSAFRDYERLGGHEFLTNHLVEAKRQQVKWAIISALVGTVFIIVSTLTLHWR